MKKLLVYMCILSVIIQTLTMSAWTKEVHAAPSGTPSDPFIVMTAQELSDIRSNPSAHYKLGEDIDLAGYDYDGAGPDTGGWVPIGNASTPFTGTFEGNGYTIRNMTINRPSYAHIGLFGRINNGAELRNVRLLDINVTGSSTPAGGLVGNIVSGTIQSSFVTGRVSVSGADAPAGGLVGVNANGAILNSHAVVSVSGGGDRLGGLVGTNAGTIQDSYAIANVSGRDQVGGLVGYNINAASSIQNSYAKGNISGRDGVGGLVGTLDGKIQNSYAAVDVVGNDSVGGLVGVITYVGGDVQNSFSVGKVTGATAKVGGLAGYNSGTVTNSVWDMQTTGQTTGYVSSSGPITGDGKTTEQMKTVAAYPMAFTSVWGIREGVSYPYLLAYKPRLEIDPLPVTTYDLSSGLNSLSVTGSVYDGSAGEQITVEYVIKDSSSATVATATYSLDATGSAQSIDRSIPLTGFSNGTYTMHITAEDSYNPLVVAAPISFAVDDHIPPSVSFGTNGSESWGDSASTAVTVTDSGSGVDSSSIRYIWTTDTIVPATGWSSFGNGGTLRKSNADGDWYLHIQASDMTGNIVNAVSNRFRLDNTVPTASIVMTQADGGAYADNTWTNQSITISAAASDANSVTTLTYSLDSGVTWNSYATPVVLQNDGIYPLRVKAVDSTGNTTVEHRTVKISTSGLRLTPTLTKADGSAYTSGAWTNGSVTARIYAEAGASGIAALTYALNGGAAQTYVNNSSITFDQDGAYTLLFLVTDTAGNALSAPLAINIDKTAPVVTLIGPSSLHLTVGSSYTEEGASATDSGSGTSGVVITGSVNTNVPETYTFWYNASDLAGNTAVEVTRTVIVDAAALPPTSPRRNGGSSPAVTLPVIDLNGVSLDLAAIDTSKPSVTLEVTPKDGVAYVSIPASILANLQDKSAAFFIEIKAPYGSYKVPVNLASIIPGLKELLSKNNLKAEDISFKITLTDKSGNKDILVAFDNGLPNGKVLGAIVDFSIEIVNAKTGQSIGTADNFSKALTRVIPMPKEVTELPEQWGAFRYNEATKKFEFVAATTRQIEGVWYVMISSYSNSVYTVAQNEVSFADVQQHWSLPVVELAAAKGLVEGVGGGMYDPNKAVTRAEFTAMLVRALGRATSAGNTEPYDDVKQGVWYFAEVAAAKELGLLDFVNGNSFKPDKPLTREEMASILAAVITLEKLPTTMEFESLNGYKDMGSAEAVYLEDIRLMVKLEIMTGTNGDMFSPKGETTRAQAAVVFIRTLRALGMID
jgi:hypothetical protein